LFGSFLVSDTHLGCPALSLSPRGTSILPPGLGGLQTLQNSAPSSKRVQLGLVPPFDILPVTGSVQRITLFLVSKPRWTFWGDASRRQKHPSARAAGSTAS